MPTRPAKHDPMQAASSLKRHDAANRPTTAARGYGGRWQRLARMFLRRHPLCADPFDIHAAERRIEAAECVDHVVPLRHGGSNDESNLQALCTSCHARKTVLHDGGFGRRPVVTTARGGKPVKFLQVRRP